MAVVARIATVTVVERVMAAEVVRKMDRDQDGHGRARDMAVLPHVKVAVDPIATVIAEVVEPQRRTRRWPRSWRTLIHLESKHAKGAVH